MSKSTPFTVQGVGLSSGRHLVVELHSLVHATRPGIQWFEAERPWNFSWSVQRTTLLHHSESKQALSTPEHLSAGMLGWPRASVAIRAAEGDIPILDGSAQPWVELLTEMLGVPTHELAFYEAPLSEDCQWKTGFWNVSPHPSALHIEYSLDQHGYTAHHRVTINTFADVSDILLARTFIFESDYHVALQANLLPGAQVGCGLLLRSGNGNSLDVLSGAPLRHPNEPVLHKIQDLLGDFALLGPFLPKLHIRIHNGGHVAHQQILTRLKSYVFARYPT
jgi:UDP-3-O-[3-hydroxymyristoyl] N-acetylglucosamine deacetylase